MAIRKWLGLIKAQEELNELGVELMKLQAFPSGDHPGRRRSVILSTEDECADVLAAVDYFIDRNNLDRKRIEKRKAVKYRKFSRWLGIPQVMVDAIKRNRKPRKTATHRKMAKTIKLAK